MPDMAYSFTDSFIRFIRVFSFTGDFYNSTRDDDLDEGQINRKKVRKI